MLNLTQFRVGGLLLEIDPTVVTRFLHKKSLKKFGVPQALSARTFNNKRYFGLVIADEALKPGKPLQQCKHVQAMHQRFVGGLKWRHTEYSNLYQKKYKKEMSRRLHKKCDFDFLVKEKLNQYDRICVAMRQNGYQQSSSIEENVEVALAENGQVFLIDGRHRLALAQLIGLKKIPVVVNLIAESFAKSFVDKSMAAGRHSREIDIHSSSTGLTACPCNTKKNVLLNPLRSNRLGAFMAQLIGLKRTFVSADFFVESCSKLLVSDAESLRLQLLCQNVDQRLNALCVVPGGLKDKGVLVNAHQRHHFSS